MVQFWKWNSSQICDLISRQFVHSTIFIKPETIFLGTNLNSLFFVVFEFSRNLNRDEPNEPDQMTSCENRHFLEL